MLGLLSRFLFTSTAVAPVALVYAYALWKEGLFKQCFIALGTAGILLTSAALFLVFARNVLQTSDIKMTSAETTDQENVAFLLLYISPLFTDNVSQLNFSIAVPVAILFILVIMCGNSYHFNPLLNFLGWHFYKVSTNDNVTRVLITRRSIRNVVDRMSVIQLTDYVLMERRPNG